MKIKEAAQYCGLTEKAIRLYENKGLIHPQTEEKNGRIYREYDEDTIRTLLTVGTLRRAAFSMEQIGIMQSSPNRIPEVFEAYREEVKENAERMSALSRVMESMDVSEAMDLDAFANRLAAAMIPENIQPSLPGEIIEPSSTVPAVQFHYYVWDEDISLDDKEKAYQRFMKKQERREKIERVLFAVPWKIAAIWRSIIGKLTSKIRDENHKIRNSAKAIAALVCIVVILSGSLISAYHKSAITKQKCADGIFRSMHDIVYTLRNTMYTSEYTYGHSEEVCKNLMAMEALVSIGEHEYTSWYYKSSFRFSGFRDLIDAMGCTYSSLHNGKNVASILHDGELSDDEMYFIEALYIDLEAVYSTMLAEDGLNKRDDLRYDEIRNDLNPFLEKWYEWSWSGEAPYYLLNQE